MLEFFELTASGRVHYRVVTEDGLVEIGNADLPRAPVPLTTGQPHFTDTTAPAKRCGWRATRACLTGRSPGATAPQRVVIQVAEPLT